MVFPCTQTSPYSDTPFGCSDSLPHAQAGIIHSSCLHSSPATANCKIFFIILFSEVQNDAAVSNSKEYC